MDFEFLPIVGDKLVFCLENRLKSYMVSCFEYFEVVLLILRQVKILDRPKNKGNSTRFSAEF